MRKLQIAAIVAALLIGLPQLSPAQENPSDTYRQLKLFSEVFERVRADYVEEVSDQDLIEFAIQGMLSTLDPHSSLASSAATRQARTMQAELKMLFASIVR